MELRTYLDKKGRGAVKRLAERLGLSSHALVSQWASKVRPVPVSNCYLIELHTEGQVTRQELRPHDWQTWWPDLAKPKGKRAKASA